MTKFYIICGFAVLCSCATGFALHRMRNKVSPDLNEKMLIMLAFAVMPLIVMTFTIKKYFGLTFYFSWFFSMTAYFVLFSGIKSMRKGKKNGKEEREGKMSRAEKVLAAAGFVCAGISYFAPVVAYLAVVG